MLQGNKTCLLDDKNRLKMPAAFRKQLLLDDGEQFVLIKAPAEECLYLYPKTQWLEFLKNELNPIPGKQGRDIRNAIMGQLSELEMDKAGRLVIPSNKLAEVGCSSSDEIFIYGNINKFQIWKPETYDIEVVRKTENLADVMDSINF